MWNVSGRALCYKSRYVEFITLWMVRCEEYLSVLEDLNKHKNFFFFLKKLDKKDPSVFNSV